MANRPEKLVFVYNANSGRLNALIDLLHKNISPRTYPCQLCAVTYNNSGMLPDWKAFAEKFSIPVIFLHKDELISMYGAYPYVLPAAYAEVDGKLVPFIPAEIMRAIRSVEELKSATMQAFTQYQTGA